MNRFTHRLHAVGRPSVPGRIEVGAETLNDHRREEVKLRIGRAVGPHARRLRTAVGTQHSRKTGVGVGRSVERVSVIAGAKRAGGDVDRLRRSSQTHKTLNAVETEFVTSSVSVNHPLLGEVLFHARQKTAGHLTCNINKSLGRAVLQHLLLVNSVRSLGAPELQLQSLPEILACEGPRSLTVVTRRRVISVLDFPVKTPA